MASTATVFGKISESLVKTMKQLQPGEEFYAHYDGTSVAAPHVAGVAALLLGAIRETGKGISVRSLIDLIYKNAIPKGDLGHNNRYGRGIINPLNTLREILEG